MKLKIGDKAPDFELSDQEEVFHSLSDQKGKWVLLYFYPKDETPGCVKQACGIRDFFPEFNKLGITVFGISADSVKSHATMSEKHALPFKLLADEQKKVINAYGVWGKKKFLGREYMGILRTSFLLDPMGMIVKIYEKVNPAKHADTVLADMKELNGPTRD